MDHNLLWNHIFVICDLENMQLPHSLECSLALPIRVTPLAYDQYSVFIYI